MADDVIDGRTDGLWKPAIIERCRDCFLYLGNMLVANAVELSGGYARPHMFTDHVEHVGSQSSGDSHFVLLGRCFDGYIHRLTAIAHEWTGKH